MKKYQLYLIVLFLVFAVAFSGYGVSTQAMNLPNPSAAFMDRYVPNHEPYPENAWSTEKCVSFWKVKFCVGAKWEDLKLKVGIGILGKWKWWAAVDLKCYEYKVPPGSAKLCVTKYTWKKPKLSFTLALSGCVDVYFKKYCEELYRKSFSVNIP